MRDSSPQLPHVLTGSFSHSTRFDIWHGSDRVREGLRAEEWSLDPDLTAEVKTSGPCVLVYESVSGESLSPRGTVGDLSPFRAMIEPILTIKNGSFTEDISLGFYTATAVPIAEDVEAEVNGERVTVASRVHLNVMSLDYSVRRRGFHYPEQPSSLGSAWDELRRITLLPVDESVPDVAIPADTTWEAKEGGRLEAVQTLAALLGGTAVVNSVGALTVIPDAIGPSVAELTVGEDGTIIDLSTEIDTEQVYNTVVGVFEKSNRDPLYAVASVDSGDLAVDGLYGEHTYFVADDMPETQTQADAYVQAVLSQITGTQQYDVIVTCHVNPLVEIGDVVTVKGRGSEIVGRIVSLSMSESHLMQATVRATRELK